MENYILKKEKEYIIEKKRENPSIITGACFKAEGKDIAHHHPYYGYHRYCTATEREYQEETTNGHYASYENWVSRGR